MATKLRHGLNTYSGSTETKDNRDGGKRGNQKWHGLRDCSEQHCVNATNLTTSGNGWGGVNVDKGAQVTIGGTTNLGEESSIVWREWKQNH